ncbi:MAG: Hsp20/alpha crystallin family protein [Bacteroidetes bacterium]|nr:Hsp20/alpha crystallin family protein [Bacteroidota bacterium]MBK8145772.1 Hsp20/alpha crystallin family protein [Bacteroidota bacterium]MBP6315924.1 Hsp20/alpha crystallin family protein [Chitinophagaceae bacterium]
MTHIRVKTPAFVPNFFNTLDRFLADDFANMQVASPAVNIIEKENGYHLEMRAPGLAKSDFKIELDEDLLSISYEKNEEKSEETEKFIKREFSTKSFKRTFTVNADLKVEEISATYEDGILRVDIPKKEEKVKEVRKININ